MSNIAVFPIILPLIAAVILAFIKNHGRLTEWVAILFSFLFVILAIYLNVLVTNHGTIVLETGSWKAPFGIVMVADSLASILVLTTSLVTLAAVLMAKRFVNDQLRSHYFYAFVFFLISGVSGAFLTGDLFNLFVFFEVLLMASYALIIIGGGKVQLRESMKYMIINLFSSVLFVTVISFLYAVVGTVNMAQIAERVQSIQQAGVLTTIAVLLFFVFATKAALFPLYYWMPKSYIVPNPIVSVLFGALLTKVGIYSILRVFSTIFVYDIDFTHNAFIWIAGVSLLFGVFGALSTNNVKLILAYNIVPAIGFMLMGIGFYNANGMTGSVYYLVHDMFIKAGLFLLIGVLVYVAGTSDLRKMGGYIHYYPVLGWLFFLACFILAGIPPFSGFIGKLLLLQGAFEHGEIAILIISLITSLLILYSMIKIFIQAFWGEKQENYEKKSLRGMISPIVLMLAFSVFLGIGANYVLPTIESIGIDLLDPEIYIKSVLKE